LREISSRIRALGVVKKMFHPHSQEPQRVVRNSQRLWNIPKVFLDKEQKKSLLSCHAPNNNLDESARTASLGRDCMLKLLKEISLGVEAVQ